MELSERVSGCFRGLTTGDAIGKQSEILPHADVRRWYPEGIHGFCGVPGAVIERYVGNPRYEWRTGETTDDTEQTLAVAQAILRDHDVRHASVGHELLKCKKSVHPGVRSIWSFQQSGDPIHIAAEGEGCGAATRVAPVGVLFCSKRLDDLVQGAYEASISTHGGQRAICGAAAVACAVSAALDGRSSSEILRLSVRAARMAEVLAPSSALTMATAIQAMHDDLSRWATLTAHGLAARYFPDRPETKVPLAINLAVITQSARDTILLAANVGGDADSVASIGGAIAGAMKPESTDQNWFEVVTEVNADNHLETAQALANLRR
jgi:ADP-ribosylglycohydrolase